MIGMFDILIPAFTISIVLLGIHSYFGLEIIKRGIIFTDLAMGQMSALGAAVSLYFFHGHYLYLISLAFALVSGVLIAFISRRNKYMESFIGLMYALGISGVFLLLSNSAHGMEEFQNLMAADILFTPRVEIIKVIVLYSFLGAFIFFVLRKLDGILKDILFFITFAITVTSSVKLAGVLVVFAILISPAMISLSFKKGNLILKAWGIGTIINLIAIVVSYTFDLPTGYTIVFVNGFFAIITLLGIKNVKNHDSQFKIKIENQKVTG